MLKSLQGGAFSNDDDSIAKLYEKTVNAKIQMDPVGQEDGDVDNDGDKDSSDEYLKKRRKAIGKAIASQKKTESKSPIKLDNKQEKVKLNPKVNEEDLNERMERKLRDFASELASYAKSQGGIDKKYFENIASIASSGRMPSADAIQNDTDPRDFVLGMMAKTFPKSVMKNYKGVSPSFDYHLKGMKEDAVKEMSADKAYNAMDKADKQSRGEMSVTDPKKAAKRRRQAQKFADYSIKKTLNKEEQETSEACWTGFKQVGMKKKGQKMVPNCVPEENDMKPLTKKERENLSHGDLVAMGYSKKQRKKLMDTKEETELDEVESAYAKQIADYKAKGGTVKKYTGPDKKKVKGAISGFKKKLAKTMKIHSDQDEKERSEKEQQDEGSSIPMDKGSVEKRVKMFKRLRDKKASQGYQKTGLANEENIDEKHKKVKGDGFPSQIVGRVKMFHNVDETPKMKIPPYANRKTAQAEKKAREEAQRKRAGLDEVIKKSWKKGTYHVKDADGKIHGTYKSGSHASKAMHKLMDKGDHKELEVSRANEEVEEGYVKQKKGDKLNVGGSGNLGASLSGPKGKGDFMILKKAYKPGQDQFHMVVIDDKGIINKDWGSHPSLDGAKKFAKQRGYKEEVEIEEHCGECGAMDHIDEKKGSDYQLYHKDFSSAMQHAYAVAKKRGYTVDKDDIDNKVATGPRKPSSGKTNRYILGTDKKQNLHVQVANLDDKRYELNMYIEDVQLDEKAVSKQQQKFFGLVRAIQKGKASGSPEAEQAAKEMSAKDVKDYAGTKHEGLPKKIKSEEVEMNSNTESIEEMDKQYNKYEAGNQHGKAAVYAWKKYHNKNNPKEVAHGKELKAINKRHDERGHLSHEDGEKRYKISKTYTDRMVAKHSKKEEVNKNLSKINKLLEKRKTDEEHGAGEEGTTKLTKKYRKDTPGQGIEEGNIIANGRDPFRIFEQLVHYLMGTSIKNIENYSYYKISETPDKLRLENTEGALATITIADVQAFYDDPEMTMEEFIELIDGFGVKELSEKEDGNSVIGDEGTPAIGKDKMGQGIYTTEPPKTFGESLDKYVESINDSVFRSKNGMFTRRK